MLDRYIEEIKENGFCIIKNYYNHNEIKTIFKDIDAILSQGVSLVGQKKIKDDIDDKYLFLKEHHKTIKSRCYDMFGYMASLNRFINKQNIMYNTLLKLIKLYRSKVI